METYSDPGPFDMIFVLIQSGLEKFTRGLGSFLHFGSLRAADIYLNDDYWVVNTLKGLITLTI
jgi:hypothetical protein